jgi:hypothetical protein
MGYAPDRVDASVPALTALMIEREEPLLALQIAYDGGKAHAKA